MKIIDKELTPVDYSEAAIKVLHTHAAPDAICFRIHWHDRLEIIRLKRGNMMIDFGSSTLTLHPGQLAIFSPKTPHRGVACGEGADYDVLMFDVRSFYNGTPVCGNHLPALFEGRVRFAQTTDNTDTVACFDEICSFADPNSMMITANVYRLLYLLFENNAVKVGGHTENGIKEITDYIEEHFDEELNTALLSRRFGYTTSHFCRKFKEATGLTPVTYVKIFRLEKARRLIKDGQGNVSAVAAACGFADANYFARCFKAHFGLPPTAYKK